MNNSPSIQQVWWLYIIETDKGNLYTGITNHLLRRWQQHCAVARGEKNAKGAKFFRSQTPLEMVYQECFSDRSTASKREAELKKLKAEEKRVLIRQPLGKTVIAVL